MKTEKTYIDAALFQAIILESGLKFEVQKGFVKISAAKGINCYVAKQTRVARVDLSGFTMGGDGFVHLGTDGFGAVAQELDFTRTEAEILETFALVLEHMKTLPERKIVRKPRVKGDSSAKGWSLPVNLSDDSLAASLAEAAE